MCKIPSIPFFLQGKPLWSRRLERQAGQLPPSVPPSLVAVLHDNQKELWPCVGPKQHMTGQQGAPEEHPYWKGGVLHGAARGGRCIPPTYNRIEFSSGERNTFLSMHLVQQFQNYPVLVLKLRWCHPPRSNIWHTSWHVPVENGGLEEEIRAQKRQFHVDAIWIGTPMPGLR